MNSDPQTNGVQPGTSRVIAGAWLVSGALVAVAVIGGLTMVICSAQSAATRNRCDCRLKQLGLALANYEATYHCFPPAYIADDDGKPMHSWRVLILPFLEGQEIYRQYRFDEPWNGPHNIKLATQSFGEQFRCPAASGDPTETNYLAVVGPDTAWRGAEKVRMRDLEHGTSRTIAIVEVLDTGINWLEPRDLAIDDALRGINPTGAGLKISSNHTGGAQAGYFDGHVTLLPDGTSVKNLRALLSRNGEPPVAPDYQP